MILRFFSLVVALALSVSSVAAPPERPRYTVDTREPTQKGRRIHVPAAGDFQKALDEAQPGDTVLLDAAGTYVGPFRLRPRSSEGWIVVTTSATSKLPKYGGRIHPSHAARLPKLRARAAPVIKTEGDAHHYRFIGLDIAPVEGSFIHELVQLGDRETDVSRMPHHIIFDRCYIHGDRTVGARRGIALNSRATAVIGSYLSEFKEAGADSQAIAGWNGSGPFKISNNYLEGAGENVMFGGADPSVRGLVPSDIEVTLNHMAKPLRWKKGHQDFEGTAWTVKNLFELKNARRVLIDRNLFEYNWVDGQNGIAILFTVRNQDGRAPWSTVEDVVFSGNLVRHAGGGINILGRDDLHPSGPAQRIRITNNLFEDIGGQWGAGRLFQLLDGTRDVTIDRNTAHNTGSIVIGGDHAPHVGFVFTRNIAAHNQYGITGSGTGPGFPSLQKYFPDAVVKGNVIVGGNPSLYPRENTFPATADAARAAAKNVGADVREIAATARRITSESRDVAISTAVSRETNGAAVVFFAAAGLLVYVYAGYPLLIWTCARIRPRRRAEASIEPTVSIVLVAHNEADNIEGRIDNLLALDYPRDRVEVLIGSDGSTDDTAVRARRYASEGVAVHEWRERRGKPAVLNDLIARATGEIVVFADARQRFERQALRALTSRFADSEVGAVSGELLLRPAGEDRSIVGRGEAFYWRYEKLIRSSESLSGSTLCATGAIYAIRRRLFEPIPADTILDDVLIPARIVLKGFAVLFAADAKAFDDVAATATQEHIRKVRTTAGNFQLLAREPWLFDPRRNPLWLATVSHKALRLTLPLLHAALLVANLALTHGLIFQIAMAAQLSFYTAAIAGHALRNRTRRPLVVSVPYAMCLMLGATVVGFVRFVTHTQRVTWQRAIAGATASGLRTAAYAGPDRRVLPRRG